jgi:hypothetical protein
MQVLFCQNFSLLRALWLPKSCFQNKVRYAIDSVTLIMNIQLKPGALIPLLITLATTALFAAQPSTNSAPITEGPKIKFDNEVFNAGKIPAGKALNHTFVFTNTGNQTLEVTKATGTCHCTVVDNNWTRRVEPGQTGTIPVSIDVRPEWAGSMSKTVLVESTDKSKPPTGLPLTINFDVWKPIEISQPYVFLNVPVESTNEVSTVVRVDNNTPQPLALHHALSSNPAIAVEIKTNEPGKHYALIIRALPPFQPGTSFSANVTAATSSSEMPTAQVNATVTVQPLVSVSPPHVLLEAPPLASAVQKPVTVLYQGSGSLHVSNAVFSAKDVDVQIAETQPGKLFTVTLAFPAGFDSQGKTMELRMNSSAPQMPMITIPVQQLPSPVQRVFPKPASASVSR